MTAAANQTSVFSGPPTSFQRSISDYLENMWQTGLKTETNVIYGELTNPFPDSDYPKKFCYINVG